jgi:hypothetical protein
MCAQDGLVVGEHRASLRFEAGGPARQGGFPCSSAGA